jgi:hypothetical protein
MKNICYTVSLLIAVYWALGTFVWDLGFLVHSMLGVAVLSFVSGTVSSNRA